MIIYACNNDLSWRDCPRIDCNPEGHVPNRDSWTRGTTDILKAKRQVPRKKGTSPFYHLLLPFAFWIAMTRRTFNLLGAYRVSKYRADISLQETSGAGYC